MQSILDYDRVNEEVDAVLQADELHKIIEGLAASTMTEVMIDLTWGWALKNNDTITFTGKALSLT